jgi:beta-lactamase superfamily II metal-dependent hydrolase
MSIRFRSIFLAIVALLLVAADSPTRTLDIYFIDVMGGAATLIVTPERQSLLIDSGWPALEDRDPKRIVHVLRDVAGLDHIDNLATTHWHRDHYGGIEGLARLVRIDQFWDRGLPDPGARDGDRAAFPDGPRPDDPLGIAYRKISDGKRRALRPGDTLPLKGVDVVVLASGGEVQKLSGPSNPSCSDTPPDQKPDASDNARSLAFRLRMGRFDFLDCGDLTWNVEKALVCPVDTIGPIDVYQVTHHGMSISNHPTLVRTVAPTVAIMNNGPRKGGDAATVKLLKEIPSIEAAYQLHKNAATGPDENTDAGLIANADAAGGQFIHVAVEPDGSRYRVQIGTDGPVRTFASR